MATAQHEKLADGAPHTDPSGEERPNVVRLSVNLAPTVADALKTTAGRKGLSITEAIRHAIAIWKLVTDEQAKGNRLMIVSGDGDRAQYREIVMV